MGFFEEYKKQIITIASVVLVIVALITGGRKLNATVVDNALGFVITPLQKVTTTVSDWIGDKVDFIKNKTDLEAENKELKARVEELEAENKRLSYFEAENKKLSDLLEISQKYASYATTGTQIIAKDPGNWYDIFIIDKGKKHGLSSNMVLTSAGGLVGRIVESGYIYSKVESLLDSRSSVPAMSLRTNDLGIVKGDYSLMEEGLCRMEYIDTDAEIIQGDEIVTSQLSDIYPPGIVIGKVKEIKTDSNGLTKYAIIEPAVDFKHLDTLLVISELFQKETSEEDN